MSAYKDAQANNDITRNVKQYTDIDLFFGKKSSDSDISKVTDIQAVKRSIRNLVLLNAYEKPFHPEIAGGVREMLFELMTPITAQIIAKSFFKALHGFNPFKNAESASAIMSNIFNPASKIPLPN